MNTKENHEKQYYGYRAVKYFIVALIAGGIVTIALAFIFTAWLSILCLVLGVVLLSSGVFVICDSFNGSLLKTYNVKNMQELLEKVQQMGVEDVKYERLKKAGVNLGGLVHILEIGYLSGRKV